MRLHRQKHDARIRNSRDIVGTPRMSHKVVPVTDDANAGGLHRRQMRAARDQRDVEAGPRQMRSKKSTDGAGANDGELHARPIKLAMRVRWILPVAVRGMASGKIQRTRIASLMGLA